MKSVISFSRLLSPAGLNSPNCFDDLTVLEVDTDECVIVATAFDDGPVHDVVGGGAERIAHVALLVDFFLTSARLAIGEELGAAKLSAASAVDDVHEAELDRVGHGDFVIDVPRADAGTGFLGKLIE